MSQAGALALSGFLPVCHFRSPAFSPRERTSKSTTTRLSAPKSCTWVPGGTPPGGPGALHQAVRDIASLAGTPGFVMLRNRAAPPRSHPSSIIVSTASSESAYLRLVSIPCHIPFSLPQGYVLREGKGAILREGRDAVLARVGPILLAQAFVTASELLEPLGIGLRVVNPSRLEPRRSRTFCSRCSAIAGLLLTSTITMPQEARETPSARPGSRTRSSRQCARAEARRARAPRLRRQRRGAPAPRARRAQLGRHGRPRPRCSRARKARGLIGGNFASPRASLSSASNQSSSSFTSCPSSPSVRNGITASPAIVPCSKTVATRAISRLAFCA